MDDYNELLAKYEELRQEYDEFRKSSQEYERELELHGDQLEQKTQSLQIARQRSENELDSLRNRLTEYQSATRQQLNHQQDELERMRAEISDKNERIRKLELTNDDLERSNRALQANCDGLEQQLEAALEQNAFLQSELDERESVCLLIQHLRDELRDAQRENEILQSRLNSHRTRVASVCSTEPNRASDLDVVDSTRQAQSAAVDVTDSGRMDTEEIKTPLSWTDRRSLLEGADSDVHRVGLSTVGAHTSTSAFVQDAGPAQSLASACASVQAQAQAASAAAGNGTLSPAVRIEALAIVNQIVRHVSALESSVRKQLDGDSAGVSAPSLQNVAVPTGNPNPHKRLCLTLSGLSNAVPSLNTGANSWLSPSAGTGLSRFDFVNVYGTLRRNRERTSSASPSTPKSFGINMGVAGSPGFLGSLATSHRMPVESSTPR